MNKKEKEEERGKREAKGSSMEESHSKSSSSSTTATTKKSSNVALAGSDAVEAITERLSQLDNLYFPPALHHSTLYPSQRKSLLLDLFSRDIPVFLERYGSQLTLDELKELDVLRDEDYEINWHLKHLRSLIDPSSEDLKSKSVQIKNRRRAYMDKLMLDGNYFSEDSMRDREPYLHHEFVGKFQDPSGRSMARPGDRWSETLLRRAEEGLLVEKIRREQQRLGVSERDWIGNERVAQEEQEEQEEEEEEEEEDEEEDAGDKGTHQQQAYPDENDTSDDENKTSRPSEGTSLSAEEMQDRMDQFTHVMQQKFLSGADHQHLDYSRIDEDETLDDHWMREANYDAEEKYFADV